jgi:predicted nucleotidyltransferase
MRRYSRSEVEGLARQLKDQLGEAASVVLIGSVARNCAMRRSDIDILLVGDEEPRLKLRLPRFEVHRFTKMRFLRDLQNADDFPNWCIRFGVPLAGGTYWDEILSRSGENSKWPDWRRKITVAAKRLLATQLFIESGDPDAAGESALFAYDHLIRGLLLRESVFPLSRPELVQQVKPLSPQLSACLHTLLHDEFSTVDTARVLRPLSEAVNTVAPELYQDFSERLRRIVLQVRSRRVSVKAPVAEAAGVGLQISK